MDELASQITYRNLKPRLVVFDTFARCFVGGDENNAKDVGEFVATVQEFQRTIGGAAALIVHHTGKGGQNARVNDVERGSSALRGAADTMLLLTKTGDALTLICNKQKDSDKGDEIPLRVEVVPLHCCPVVV